MTTDPPRAAALPSTGRAWAAVVLLTACGGPQVEPAAQPPPGAMFVEVVPDAGPLAEQLTTQVAKARASGRTPFLQVYGDWCGSCRELRASLSDPLMVDAFAGTWVVMVDTAQWASVLERELWLPEKYSVPSFYAVREDGTLGESITGKAWDENVPTEMAPPLRDFFRVHASR